MVNAVHTDCLTLHAVFKTTMHVGSLFNCDEVYNKIYLELSALADLPIENRIDSQSCDSRKPNLYMTSINLKIPLVNFSVDESVISSIAVGLVNDKIIPILSRNKVTVNEVCSVLCCTRSLMVVHTSSLLESAPKPLPRSMIICKE